MGIGSVLGNLGNSVMGGLKDTAKLATGNIPKAILCVPDIRDATKNYTVEQMIEQNNRVNRTVHKQTDTVTSYDTTEHTYTNVNTQQIVQQNENVEELVRQGVQRELGSLSEKIYHRLEKRLESEKRRRGY